MFSSVGTPSAIKFSSPSGDGVSSRLERRSVTTRLTSFRHLHVAAAQSRFDVGDRNPQLRGDDAACERGVDVADDDDQVRLFLEADPLSNSTITRAVCSACDPDPTPI